MKDYKWLILIVLFIFIAVCAHAANYMDDKQPVSVPVAKEKTMGKNDLVPPKEAAKPAVDVKTDDKQEKDGQNQIKAQSICIGEDCRNKWPVLKCANFSGRPAGETGDQFCSPMNKTCVAVSIGGGQSFFGECSIAAKTVHECRCCWVE